MRATYQLSQQWGVGKPKQPATSALGFQTYPELTCPVHFVGTFSRWKLAPDFFKAILKTLSRVWIMGRLSILCYFVQVTMATNTIFFSLAFLPGFEMSRGPNRIIVEAGCLDNACLPARGTTKRKIACQEHSQLRHFSLDAVGGSGSNRLVKN